MPKFMAGTVARSLRQRIDAGEWRDGLRLPDERALAGEYRVARNTVRRAIDAIAADGLVSREVGRGTFLRGKPSRDEGGAGVLAALHGVADTSPADMMAVRMILEPRAAALAAANAGAGDLREVAGAHQSSLAATDLATFEAADTLLHSRIFTATRNDLLSCLHGLLCVIRGQAPWLDLKRRAFTAERCAAYRVEHAAIVDALVRRDGERAAAAMRVHLESVSRNVFGEVG